MPRIPGLESIRPSISKRECNVAFEEAEIILAEMQREFDIQKQNIAHLTHLEEIHYRVSKEGVTESIKEQYRASFEALEIDTAIGQEGLLDVISDIMTAIRRGLDRISMWFEDKW
jgi:RNA-binding protein YhbY